MLCNASNHSIFRSLLTRVSQWSGVGGDKRTKLSEKMVRFFCILYLFFQRDQKERKIKVYLKMYLLNHQQLML